MSDTYLNLVNSGVTQKIAKQLGLPQPAPLRRYEPGQGWQAIEWMSRRVELSKVLPPL